MRLCLRLSGGFLLALLGVLYCVSPCGGGGSQHELLFGMSTALSGPAAELGRHMRAGVLAAFEEANRSGGVRGARLRLIALDDGYEPVRTAPNVRRLVYDYRVLAIVGNVGTPTAVAALPVVRESGTPFFGAFSGAGVLRKRPPERYVINYRASYAEETAAMVDALVTYGGLKPDEIAFFTQRDAYGDAGFAGGIAALERHGIERVSDVLHVRYDRNTVAVENAVADLLWAHRPIKAIICVGAYKPCARFIKLARQHGLNPLFLNVSFVGSTSLARELGPYGEGVIITQVVPHVDSDLPIVREYRQALSALDPAAEPTFVSLEGYIVGRILLEALRRCQGPVTREGIVDALEALGTFDLGLGVTLTLGPNDHQACDTIWPTVIRNGRVVPLAWSELNAR